MNYQVPQIEWQDQYKLDQNKVETGNWHRSFSETLIHAYQIMESMTEQNKVMVHYYNKQTQKGEPYISCPNFNSVEEAKEWVETTHYPSALIKAGFKPVSEPLTDTLIEKLDEYHQSLYERWYDNHKHPYDEGAMDAVEKAINIVKQHSDWVSADERLPDKDGKYLVYCVGNRELTKDRKELSIMRFNQKTKGGWFALSPLFKVVYRQPIQPPSEVQDD